VGDTANLSRRTKAPNERRQPDLKVLDFAKGILSLWALGKLVCSIPQIGKHCDNLLHLAHLKYFNGALNQLLSSQTALSSRVVNIDAIRGGNESASMRSAGLSLSLPPITNRRRRVAGNGIGRLRAGVGVTGLKSRGKNPVPNSKRAGNDRG
jgi:hypothetical protein